MQKLEAGIKQLEAEYNMYFAGRLPRPPWETRARVAALVKQYDRAYIQNTGDRFRFSTLQSRYGEARYAEAACATWCGTKRTRAGSTPGSAVWRNSGARSANSVRSGSHDDAVMSPFTAVASAGS